MRAALATLAVLVTGAFIVAAAIIGMSLAARPAEQSDLDYAGPTFSMPSVAPSATSTAATPPQPTERVTLGAPELRYNEYTDGSLQLVSLRLEVANLTQRPWSYWVTVAAMSPDQSQEYGTHMVKVHAKAGHVVSTAVDFYGQETKLNAQETREDAVYVVKSVERVDEYD